VRTALKIALPALAFAALVMGIIVLGTHRTGQLAFRTAVEWDRNQLVRSPSIREWRLEVPREFVVRRDGYSAAAYYPNAITKQADTGALFVWILTRLNDKDEVVPYAGGLDRNRSFGIGLGNTLVDPRRAQEDYCLTEYELMPPGKMPACAGRPGCSIHMNYFSWPVKISVEQDGSLFKEPTRVCEITRAVLSKWTISIDELHASRLKRGAIR
jgi:hypothetical protein